MNFNAEQWKFIASAAPEEASLLLPLDVLEFLWSFSYSLQYRLTCNVYKAGKLF